MRERPHRPAWLANFRREPDRTAALASYAQLAGRYEQTTLPIRHARQRALDLLALQPGETVFDLACGAGAILAALSERVGPQGQVFGIEQSPEMAAQASQAAAGCANVRVLCEPVETFRSPAMADAAILCYTHDVLQSPQALANLLAQLRPGARISVAGFCLLPAWGAPVNAWALWRARHYLSTWRGLRAPWLLLRQACPDLRLVERYHVGTGYLAVASVGGRPTDHTGAVDDPT